MISLPNARSIRSILPTILLGVTATAHAALIFQSDFNVDPDPTPGFVLSGSTASMGSTGPGGSRAIQLLDTGTGSSALATLDFDAAAFPAFSTALPGQETLGVSADFAVTNLGSALDNTNSLPRLLLRSTTTLGAAISSDTLTIGFGRTAGDRAVLYAARGDNAAPNAASAVILYDFGQYIAPASDIDTNDQYVTLAISYFQGSTEMTVSASQGGSEIGNATITGFSSGLTFTETTTAFLAATGNATTSSLFIDNVLIQTIPEPSLAFLAGLAPLALMLRRKRL
jgi:hypothetical protein